MKEFTVFTPATSTTPIPTNAHGTRAIYANTPPFIEQRLARIPTPPKVTPLLDTRSRHQAALGVMGNVIEEFIICRVAVQLSDAKLFTKWYYKSEQSIKAEGAALKAARRQQNEEEKKAKAREASRKSMAKKRANRTPQEKAADRQLQNQYSAKHRRWNRLEILKAEDARRHSDPDKPKRRRVARLKRIHDYPHKDYQEHQQLNKAKKAKKAL
ncbi:hypothetical protein BDZ89DRAFT_1223264 [Hymenopellis radicata]|nr:hypothetical protein BDZ89DRAFT_1223264 [Hymenopellis radicata]